MTRYFLRLFCFLALGCEGLARDAHSKDKGEGPSSVERLVDSSRRSLRQVAKRAASSPVLGPAVGVLGCGLVGYSCGPALDAFSGVSRAFKFWSRALPIYLDYRWMDWRLSLSSHEVAEKEQHWSEAHERHGPQVLQLLLDLRGFYVKVGQVASTFPDVFPSQYIDSLKALQGEHPELLSRPVRDIWQIIRKDLGTNAELIDSMDEEPLGAAATAQVHRAVLQDGRDVVVKVQFPEAQRLFRQDFSNVRLWCTLLQPEYLPYIDEVRQSFLSEFDFRREARDLEDISRSFNDPSNPFMDQVYVPGPVPELAGRNVVVMDFIAGTTLLNYGLRKQREMAESSYLTVIWQGWFVLQELRRHLATLVSVQGYQVFVDGVFNGDPHPGNILLMPDGRLGLIDYGNVNRISIDSRATLGQLVLALARGDEAGAVALGQKFGYQTKYNRTDTLLRYLRIAFDTDAPDTLVLADGTKQRDIRAYLEALRREDPLVSVPEGMVMVARNAFLLRGLASHFGVRLRIAVAWRPFAEYAVQFAAACGSGDCDVVHRSAAWQRKRTALGRNRSQLQLNMQAGAIALLFLLIVLPVVVRMLRRCQRQRRKQPPSPPGSERNTSQKALLPDFAIGA
mmetsp:Transcript_21587/g.50368  ORF Transcript_21587/g.50368 Transcript_21587/m.50368 type:complete len:622 (+) Transcript_21587:104-1969(+)